MRSLSLHSRCFSTILGIVRGTRRAYNSKQTRRRFKILHELFAHPLDTPPPLRNDARYLPHAL